MTNSSSGQPRVSVNLDIANLPPEAPAYILREAAAYGRIVVARAFADYRRNDLGDLPVQLFQYGFQLIHCPSWPDGGGRLKSVVDSILAQDLRDQAEDDPSLEVFVLGSGDRDFMAAMHALRRHGRRVIIAATPDSSNRSLVAGADGYIPLPMADRPERLERSERLERYPAPTRRLTPPTLPAIPQPLPAEVQAPVPPPPPPAPPAAAQPAPPVPPAPPAPPAQRAHQFHPEPPLSMAALSDQILELVGQRPKITPRQVLQVLAPHNETGSARRRQAVGDAVAMLLQQGKLVRRAEVVRGRMAEVLAFPVEEPVAAPAPAPAPVPAVVASQPLAPSPRPRVAPRRSAAGYREETFRRQQAEVAPTAADIAFMEELTPAPPSRPDVETVPVAEVPAPDLAVSLALEADVTAEPEAVAKPRRRPRRRSRAAAGPASGDGKSAGDQDAPASDSNVAVPAADVEAL